ncbi:putative lipopolysaccharide heptosyltransferase III|nr:putative lipopolysaccharide heptosyltransferase III [Candidatus Pantoea persica]
MAATIDQLAQAGHKVVLTAALNTACIALFGPTKLTFWRPWGDNNQVIWVGNYGLLPATPTPSIPDPPALSQLHSGGGCGCGRKEVST